MDECGNMRMDVVDGDGDMDHRRSERTMMMQVRSLPAAFVFALVGALYSCGQSSPTIDFDHVECSYCRMNVVDRQFGAALTTLKGRQYAFDDVSCMAAHVAKGTIAEGQVAAWYVCDHAHPGVLIDATKAYYLKGEGFRSPMRGDAAAFATKAERDAAMNAKGGEPMDWEPLRKVLVQ
jgi:copper chaperone NosL